MEIDIASLDSALKVFGVPKSPPIPFKIAGSLQRQGDLWQIDSASGRLSANPFSGNLVVKEGKRGEADRLNVKVDFPTLDIAPLLTTGDAKSDAAEEPGMFVEGQVRAARLTWGKLGVSDAVLQGNTGPHNSKKGNPTFVLYGGKVEAQMETIEADGNRIALNASVTEADFSRVAALLGVAGGRVTGKLAGASKSTPRKQRTRWRFSDCPWAGRNGGYRRQHRERNYGRSFDRSLCGVPQEAGPSSRDVPLWRWDFKGRHCPVGAIAPARFRCRNKRIRASQFASPANGYSPTAPQRGDLCARPPALYRGFAHKAVDWTLPR